MNEIMQGVLILKSAFDLLFDDSETEDSDDDIKVVKNQSDSENCMSEDVNSRLSDEHFTEEVVVPRLTDNNFKQCFRVNADVFELVCKELFPYVHKKYRPGRKPLPFDKKVMITLWYLGNMDGLRAVGNRFGVGTTTTWNIIYNVCDALIKMNEQKKCIKWPTPEEAAKTAEFYLSTYNLKGVIGCIDSCHIFIRQPIPPDNSYKNRMGNHSVLLQAVSNEKMEFLFFHAGECGSIDDATLLEKSGLEAKINANENCQSFNKLVNSFSLMKGNFQISDDQHLIGDCSYPLRPWLITPYQGTTMNGVKDEHFVFNTIQYECLDDIKRTFGLLKGRFRRLYYIDSLRTMAVTKIISACCILHNICLKNEDFPDEDVKIKIVENDKESYINNEDTTSQAVLKRELLANLLH